MTVENVIADRAYSGKDNYGFIYNKDADMMQCPLGELAVRKVVTGSKKIGTNQSHFAANIERIITILDEK